MKRGLVHLYRILWTESCLLKFPDFSFSGIGFHNREPVDPNRHIRDPKFYKYLEPQPEPLGLVWFGSSRFSVLVWFFGSSLAVL